MTTTSALLRTSAPWRVLHGFGRAVHAAGRYVAPATVEELAGILARVQAEGLTVAFRGAGRSYGDAALNGETLRCGPDENVELFHAAIGGFGLFGAVVRIELRLRRVASGRLEVLALAARDLDEVFDLSETHLPTSDYLVGWIDGFATGRRLGRGVLHTARYLRLCQAHGIRPYLGVFKRHRPDRFLLSHALDEWSLALDFRVTEATRERLRVLTTEITERVLDAGGHFYFAKDSVLTPDQVRRACGEERVRQFLAIKKQVDPDGLFASDLSRRALGVGEVA